MDPVRLHVEEILGDAFVEAYGLAERDDEEEFEPDLELEEEEGK